MLLTPNITKLEIKGSYSIRNSFIYSILDSCLFIKELSITESRIDDSIVVDLLDTCQFLITLDISNSDITFNGLFLIIQKSKNLLKLSARSIMASNKSLEIDFMTSSITHLDISGSDFTIMQTHALMNALTNLESLNISKTSINNSTIFLISEIIPNLRRLNISSCKNLSDHSIQRLKQTNVTHLNISHCEFLTKAVYEFCLKSQIISLQFDGCEDVLESFLGDYRCRRSGGRCFIQGFGLKRIRNRLMYGESRSTQT